MVDLGSWTLIAFDGERLFDTKDYRLIIVRTWDNCISEEQIFDIIKHDIISELNDEKFGDLHYLTQFYIN